MIYCPSYGDVRFMVCPLYRDSTVEQNVGGCYNYEPAFSTAVLKEME